MALQSKLFEQNLEVGHPSPLDVGILVTTREIELGFLNETSLVVVEEFCDWWGERLGVYQLGRCAVI